MKRPMRVHDVQKLTGCLADLSRFISRLGEKALPLYRLMKKSDKSSGLLKLMQHLQSSKPCFPPSQCLLPQSAKSLYCFTLQPLDKSSVQYLRSSGKKKGKHSKFNAQCIISLKF